MTLELDAAGYRLRPGMFITAHIVTATHEMAVLVPKKAIVYDDGFPHVFVVSDSTATRVRLEIGFENSELLEVLEGTKKGDRIVTNGGMHGSIVGVKEKDSILVVQVAKDVRIEVSRGAISRVTDKKGD